MKNTSTSIPQSWAGAFRKIVTDFTQKSDAINPLLKAGLLCLLCLIMSKQTTAQNVTTKTKTEASQPVSDDVKPERIITGIVKAGDSNEPLANTNIYLKDSTIGTSADANGRFEFPQKLKEGDILIFSFIGYETKEYVIPKNADAPIEIAMVDTYIQMVDAVATGEVYTAKTSVFGKWYRKLKQVF